VGIYLAEQTAVFLEAVIVGAVFGAVYDLFRIWRVAFYTPAAIVFVQDILFFSICAVVTFFFGLTVIDGTLRLFVLLGELIGGVLYHFTLGRLVIAAARRIINAIKAFFRFLTRKILLPPWKLCRGLARRYLAFCAFVLKIFKKNLQNAKIRLKYLGNMLYNHIKTRYRNLRARQPRRKNRAQGITHEENRRKKAHKKGRA
jgi:spore cortex biosynthesis protein YabQ